MRLFKRRKKARGEAAHWVAVLNTWSDRDGDADSVVPEFKAWLQAARENRPAFDQLQNTWNKLACLEDRERWDLGDLQDEAKAAPRAVFSQLRTSAWGWTLAAVAMLALGGGFAFYARHYFSCSPGSLYSGGVCKLSRGRQVSPPGVAAQLDLIDGSRVSLAGELTLDVTERDRHVQLERGEASFQVAKAKVSFVVTVGSARITALGTVFSVKRISTQSCETVVSQGEVQVEVSTPYRQQSRVKAGEVAEFDGRLIQVHARAVAGGLLKFRGTSLDEAAQELNRYNPRKILVVDDRVAHRTIGGAFSPTDPEHFSEVVAATLDLARSVSRDPVQGTETIRLSPGGRGNPPRPPAPTRGSLSN